MLTFTGLMIDPSITLGDSENSLSRMMSRTISRGFELPNISILMMQKDEGALLRHWLNFHSKIIPYQSINVFDNGSSDRETVEILDGAKKAGVNIVQANRPTDFERKGAIFSKFIQSSGMLGIFPWEALSLPTHIIITSASSRLTSASFAACGASGPGGTSMPDDSVSRSAMPGACS